MQIAFISEAGTPGISDPAADLVRSAREQNLAEIIPIPGACAMTAALSVSGWQSNPSIFTGFLSLKRGRRQKFLQSLVAFIGTIVIYESPHRLRRLINEELLEIFPTRDILIAREISKYYEEFVLLKASAEPSARQQQLANLSLRGEFTVLLAPLRAKPETRNNGTP